MKLIRDKIPEIIRQNGENPVIRKAEESEYYELLSKKLLEEAKEFAFDKNTEELVDILEVVYAIAKLNNITPDELDEKRKAKAKERGNFDERFVWMENK